jgi:hypothetical protein
MSARDRETATAADAAAAGAVTLVAATKLALADLEQRLPLGMGPLEQVGAARIRAAAVRLLECSAALETDELMVRGSTGQRRAHPLLKVEQELRREISDSLGKLTFRVEQRAMYMRQQKAHQARRQAGRARKGEQA